MAENGGIFAKYVAMNNHHGSSKRRKKYFSESYEATVSENFQNVFVSVIYISIKI